MTIASVPLEKAYRLLNHGPTTLISAHHAGVENVMPASWVCPVEISPAKLSLVIDKQTFTRPLIEQSGYFAIQIPVVNQLPTIMALAQSHYEKQDKMKLVDTFYQDGYPIPLVKGCVGWLICKVLANEHHQQQHDLFVAEVLAAWADERVFKDGHWRFDEVDDSLRTVHYIAGGQFYQIGQSVKF